MLKGRNLAWFIFAALSGTKMVLNTGQALVSVRGMSGRADEGQAYSNGQGSFVDSGKSTVSEPEWMMVTAPAYGYVTLGHVPSSLWGQFPGCQRACIRVGETVSY